LKDPLPPPLGEPDNAEPTPYDDLADLVVRDPIGVALPRLVACG
jgi:hypothetical protein